MQHLGNSNSDRFPWPGQRFTYGQLTRLGYLGLHVIATARRVSVLDSLLDREGFSVLQLDVTDEASIARCKADVDALTGGKLDILVNNA